MGFSQPPGIEYTPQEFEKVCEKIYEYVKQFYSQHRLFKVKKIDVEEETIAVPTEINWDNFIGSLEKIVESDRLRQFHTSKKKELAKPLIQLKNGALDDANFPTLFPMDTDAAIKL